MRAAEQRTALPCRSATVEEIILVMRQAGLGRYADRTRALIAILWRAGLRISEALALTESDLDPKTGSVLVREGLCRIRHNKGRAGSESFRRRQWKTRCLLRLIEIGATKPSSSALTQTARRSRTRATQISWLITSGRTPMRLTTWTPVFFRKDAVRKYYGDDFYKIEDGYLRCAGIWGLRLDNDLPDHVMVYLGDLGVASALRFSGDRRHIALTEGAAQYGGGFVTDDPLRAAAWIKQKAAGRSLPLHALAERADRPRTSYQVQRSIGAGELRTGNPRTNLSLHYRHSRDQNPALPSSRPVATLRALRPVFPVLTIAPSR
ncbi:MAG: site-specific integrase [Solirubrobacteraceae bacterium]